RRLLGAAPRRWRRVIGPLTKPVNTFFEKKCISTSFLSKSIKFNDLVFYALPTVATSPQRASDFKLNNRKSVWQNTAQVGHSDRKKNPKPE
ncbi:hypothetical protein, partial [Thalassospira xiamenensis]|uniref:hypothetical protein n=1 Tax=Thalassospira xiamenensis TaxID=220697 RepID=UPI003AA8B8A0